MREELIEALKQGHGYDFIANHYPEMSTYDLKEVILAILGVVYDNAKNDKDYNNFEKSVVTELVESRDFLYE